MACNGVVFVPLVSQVKSTPSALQQIDALAFTDGMGWVPSGWTYKAMLHESVASDSDLEAEADKQATAQEHADDQPESIAQLREVRLQALRKIRDRRAEFARVAPAAFEPPTEDVAAFVAKVGCNWVASEAPLGTAIELEDSCTPTVSAAHASHPSTTFAATEDVFRFLDEAVCRAGSGGADGGNVELNETTDPRSPKKPKA